MPFLFIDQLVVQTPLTGSSSETDKLRILLTVSGNGEVQVTHEVTRQMTRQ